MNFPLRNVQENVNGGVKGGINGGVNGGDDFGDKVRIREKTQKLTDTHKKILNCMVEDKYISVKSIIQSIFSTHGNMTIVFRVAD